MRASERGVVRLRGVAPAPAAEQRAPATLTGPLFWLAMTPVAMFSSIGMRSTKLGEGAGELVTASESCVAAPAPPPPTPTPPHPLVPPAGSRGDGKIEDQVDDVLRA